MTKPQIKAIPQLFFHVWDEQSGYSAMTADTVIESGDGPKFTGLLDHNGVRRYRVKEKIQFGFCVSRKRAE